MRKLLILSLVASFAVTSCYLDYSGLQQESQEEQKPSGDGEITDDDDPADIPTVYGLYRYNGQSASYLAGRDQLGVLRSEGKVWFRIISPSTVSMIEFGDIPSGAAKGDVFNLAIRISDGGILASEASVKVKVIAVDGVRLSLKDAERTYYIVRR